MKCHICSEEIDPLGISNGKCHGCRTEFKRLEAWMAGVPRTSKRWKDYVSPTTSGRKEQLNRSTSKKLDALLDRLR